MEAELRKIMEALDRTMASAENLKKTAAGNDFNSFSIAR